MGFSKFYCWNYLVINTVLYYFLSHYGKTYNFKERLVEGIMLKVLVVYCFLSAIIWEGKSEIQSCNYLNEGETEPGRCITQDDCEELQRRARHYDTQLQLCDSNRRQNLICCPFSEVVPPRSFSNRTSAQSIYFHFTPLYSPF